MVTKKYRYTGPHSAVTLKVADTSGALVDREVVLWSGRTVELPSDHEFTSVLVQRGLLEPLSSDQLRAANASGAGRTSKPAAEQTA
jgi:hypothetical protein